ncbi:CidA/LrgA family protein [Antarcticimicrobium sediminis]|uniref:CidA/LrgA family protein n=1 Tax=Antarcticimicrobium sediminis TaxID=2546227 RepID=A0A4R5ELT2_9RHOB|nr:CidA/LrgA family protein [Antarcticimicrobium sediminis]TDE35437.1 CidA/LrgA family protein [Antarcticimicrobium sediminis]
MTRRTKFIKRLHRSAGAQIAIMLLLWGLGTALVQAIHLPLPGGILGLAVLLLLLISHQLSPLSVRRGANWFLAEMLLFFVPAVIAILGHKEFLGVMGIEVLAVILISTLAVMVVTALAVDRCLRWTMRHE